MGIYTAQARDFISIPTPVKGVTYLEQQNEVQKDPISIPTPVKGVTANMHIYLS